jgi:1-acyl-sn-glycerol-3-phosphate acyltransferase
MLEANKKKWFEKIFAVYNRNLFKRKFNSFQVSGIESLTKFPLVIYSNHSTWWDGLVAFEIAQKANLDFFVMMEEKQLKNLQLFRKLGAFSVVRENPREAIKSVNYAAKLLKDKQDRIIWIFPQGEILSNDVRPIKFYNGVSKIIEKVDQCYSVPIAMRFEFLGEFKPDIFVKIGSPQMFDKSLQSKDLTLQLAENLTETLDNLKSDIINKKTQHYQNLI